jgi:hypothetical protein
MKRYLMVALAVMSASIANAEAQTPAPTFASAKVASSCLEGQARMESEDQMAVCGKDGKWVKVGSLIRNNAPAVVYTLSGDTKQPWAPEGVWADETSVHVRLKSTSPNEVPMIYAQNDEGTLSVVGMRFWPIGIIDAETHAKRIVFRYGTREVSAVAVEH